MAATALTRMSSTQLYRGALVGVGVALAIGSSTAAIGAIREAAIAGAAAIAGLASALIRRCSDGWRHQWNQRFEQLRPTDQAADRGERAPLPKSTNRPSLEQRFPNLCSVSHDESVLRDVDLKRIKANVVHLGQRHWRKESANDPKAQERIWNSQKATAEYLLKHPDAVVFPEGLFETEFSEGARILNPQNLAVIRKFFPNGLPPDLNSINDAQRHLFTVLGAWQILYYLGHIKRLHRSISPERNDKINVAMQREYERVPPRDPSRPTIRAATPLTSLLFNQIDEALLEEIKEFIRTAGDREQQIIIVYGDGHHFEQYFDPKKYKKINCQ